jgi:hypothetical protein
VPLEPATAAEIWLRDRLIAAIGEDDMQHQRRAFGVLALVAAHGATAAACGKR